MDEPSRKSGEFLNELNKRLSQRLSLNLNQQGRQIYGNCNSPPAVPKRASMPPNSASNGNDNDSSVIPIGMENDQSMPVSGDTSHQRSKTFTYVPLHAGSRFAEMVANADEALAYSKGRNTIPKMSDNSNEEDDFNNHGIRDSKEWKTKMKKFLREKGADDGLKAFVSEMNISLPTDVTHDIKVKFDPSRLTYTGLPKELAYPKSICHFGAPLISCPRVKLANYDERIPAVLLYLKRMLTSTGHGIETEGIFRVAPETKICQQVKQRIDSGDMFGYSAESNSLEIPGIMQPDAHVYSTLIKQYFRDLEPALLNCLTRDQILEMANKSSTPENEFCVLDEKEGKQIIEPNRSVFYWLLDLLAEVAWKEDRNRMTPKNLAIVVSPNLFTCEAATPGGSVSAMEALVLAQKTAEMVHRFLLWRLQMKVDKFREDQAKV